MNHAIFMVFLVSSCLAMDSENPEPYTGCRYAYFMEHKKLPAQDYELYEHCVKLITFFNAISKKLKQKATHMPLMQGGQTRQGIYLTGSTPPSLITPWGRWFTLFLDTPVSIETEEKKHFWQEVKRFIILGDGIIECPSNKGNYMLYPVISLNDLALPAPILRPYEEYSHQFAKTKRTMATCTCREMQSQLYNHLEANYRYNKLTSQING